MSTAVHPLVARVQEGAVPCAVGRNTRLLRSNESQFLATSDHLPKEKFRELRDVPGIEVLYKGRDREVLARFPMARLGLVADILDAQ